MKKFLRFIEKTGLLLICAFMMVSGTTKAQTVITVDPGLNTINDAVTAHPGATLLLKRGQDYLIDTEVTLLTPTIIEGETEPAATKPAVVSFLANPGEAADKRMFVIGANCTLQNFGLMGFTPDDQKIKQNVACAADGIELTIDGCIFQGSLQCVEFNGHNNMKIIEKNNIFFNISTLIWDNWGGFGALWGGNNIDFKCYNNTYFMCGRVLNAGGSADGTEMMYHNSYVNTWGDTFYPSYNKNVTIKDNIFFNSQVRGYMGKRAFASGDSTYHWPGDFNGDWTGSAPYAVDSLMGDFSIFTQAADSTKSRTILIANNLKMNEKRVVDFDKANKNTVQPFMNVDMERLAKKYGWVVKGNILQEKGNTVDPQFSMGALPDGAFTNMFLNRKERWLPKAMQGPNFPYENAWRPGGEAQGMFIWPLPFNFKATNGAVKTAATDGYPLGDLNWYGKAVVAAWEKGTPSAVQVIKSESSQSAYIANDILRFKGYDSAVDAEVYSILGQKVLIAKNINELNVSSLIHGVYLVRVNSGSQAFRVVK